MRFIQTPVGALGIGLVLIGIGSLWDSLAKAPPPPGATGNVAKTSHDDLLPSTSRQPTNEPILRAKDDLGRGEPSPLTLTGLVTVQRVPVRAQVSGLLTEVVVREGQAVLAGELLARLNETQVRLEIQRQTVRIEVARQQVEEAKLNLAILNDELQRTETLTSGGFASGQTLIRTRLLAEAQSARLAALREQGRAEQLQMAVLEYRLRNHQVSAPYAGVAVEFQRQLGTYILEGEIVLYVEAHGKEIIVQLPREAVAQPERFEFSLSNDSRWSQLPVARIRHSINLDGSRTILLTVPPGVSLTKGQFVQVQVKGGEAQQP